MCTLPELEKILPLAARLRLARRLHTNEIDILGQAYLLAATPAFRRLSLADRPRWVAAAVAAETVRELQPTGDVQVDDMADFISVPPGEIERWRREEAPAAAVAGLPPRLREVVLLALAGRSSAEIAAACGVCERRARQLVVAAEAALNTMRV